jgi:MFS family permease
MAGLALGVLFGPPLGGFLYDLNGGSKILPFFLLNAITLIQGIMLYLALKRVASTKASEEQSVNDEETSLLISSIETENYGSFEKDSDKISIEEPEFNSPSYMFMLKDMKIVTLLLAMFIANASIAFTEPILPVWWKKIHLLENPSLVGILFMAQTITYSVASPIAGRFGKYRKYLIGLGLFIMTLALGFLAVPRHLAGVIPTLMGIGLAVGLIDGTCMPLLAKRLDEMMEEKFEPSMGSPKSTRSSSTSKSTTSYGQIFALGDMAINMGFCLGPIIGTWLMQSLGFLFACVLIASINLAILPLMIFVFRKSKLSH